MAQVHRITGLLGPAHKAFRTAALANEFLSHDPTGRDDVLRNGLRAHATVSFAGDWFDSFWEMAGPEILTVACHLEPDALAECTRPTMEMTKTTNGGFFAPHVDAGYADVRGPTVTFVYYLGDRATFTGGELKIGDELIEPDDDSMVLFRGSEVHEVLPVVGQDASRITINGFLAHP